MTLQLQRRNTPTYTRSVRRFIHRLRSAWHAVAISANKWARTGIAGSLILCMVPFGAVGLHAQQVPALGRQYVQLGYDQLDQLVAPVALYPDALVAQILAAATYSSQIVEADRFVQRNLGIMPPQIFARTVDTQSWDPSVKALTAFPSVLANLDRNLDWTSKLGDAYYNQPQDVMSAVQRMRQRAYAAGTLRTSPQETVVYRPGAIVIQPASPTAVYVPLYNPWFVYGAPVPVYPLYTYVPPPAGGVAVAAAIGFTAGFVVGAFASYGWGFPQWTPNWYSNTIVCNHTTYVSHSVTVVNHGYYGGYDHSAAARSYNVHVAYGPHGGTYTDQRTVANGQYNNTRTATGPNGGSYTNQRTAGNGQYTDTRTATARNSKTVIESTSRYPGGNSVTVTGPNGKTESRTVIGRGTGDATMTRSGPRGTKIKTRIHPQ